MLAYHSNDISVSCVDESIDNRTRLEEFWRLETIGIKESPVEIDDEKAWMHFNGSIRFDNGRYCVGWPWRCENPDLPDNYMLAYGRLRSNLKRLKENPKLLKVMMISSKTN